MIIINIILCFFSITFTQVFSEYSYVGNQSGMVGSVMSKPHSDSGIFYNPASLAGYNGRLVTIGKSNLFNQSYLPLVHFGLIYKLPLIGQFGLSYQSFSTKNSSIVLSSESALAISKAIYLQKDRNSSLAIGYRLNLLHWEQSRTAGASGNGIDGFGAQDNSAFGFDFGVLGGLRNKYWVGAYLKNINSPSINSQNLPRKICISIGYKPIDNMYSNLSIERLLGKNSRQIKLGFEYNLDSKITVFSGVQSNPNRLGVGLEYKIGNIEIGYSLLTHHVMSETHHFGIKIK
ncbi:MAG: hypothetical protein CMG00_08690 [Candidatus Marinimicrobia bacterium]|nr:hypothetical protein [Candidatus Neomarinimicrobiota bacterium]|tara:strand:- start:3431 stop:4297 length:867 start_codon:yes stop_codon:yes gene_type:complete